MSWALFVLLAAGPVEGSTWKLTLRAKEKSDTLDETMVVRVGPAGVFSLEPTGKTGMPSLTVREDSGAPAVVFAPNEKRIITSQETRAVRFFVGRLVVPDPEREAMSACAEGATERWLVRSIAAAWSVDASDVKLSELKVKCAVKKGVARHTVGFLVHVPRVLDNAALNGTITVDPAVWVTQWSLSGGDLRSSFQLQPKK